MKKVLLAFTLCTLISCSSVGPVGVWSYKVTGTPQGDFTGDLTVTKDEKGYTAKMGGKAGDINFNSFTYDKKESKAAGSFDFSGTSIDLKAKLQKDSLKGGLNAGGMEFPFIASRKK